MGQDPAPAAATPSVAPVATPAVSTQAPPASLSELGSSEEVTQKIAAIWSRMLGVANVSPKDSFFDLGGHSLLAVQAHREIRAELGVAKLSITDIFRAPTLGALSAIVAEKAGIGSKPAAPAPAAASAPAAAPQAAPAAISPAPSQNAALSSPQAGGPPGRLWHSLACPPPRSHKRLIAAQCGLKGLRAPSPIATRYVLRPLPRKHVIAASALI